MIQKQKQEQEDLEQQKENENYISQLMEMSNGKDMEFAQDLYYGCECNFDAALQQMLEINEQEEMVINQQKFQAAFDQEDGFP